MGPPLEGLLHDRPLGQGSGEQHDAVALGNDVVAVRLSSGVPQRLDDGRPEGPVALDHDELLQRRHREQLASSPGTHGAGADKDDAHEQEV